MEKARTCRDTHKHTTLLSFPPSLPVAVAVDQRPAGPWRGDLLAETDCGRKGGREGEEKDEKNELEYGGNYPIHAPTSIINASPSLPPSFPPLPSLPPAGRQGILLTQAGIGVVVVVVVAGRRRRAVRRSPRREARTRSPCSL